MENMLYNPAIVFALCFLAVVAVYRIGAGMAATGSPAKGKQEVYACGEDVEGDITPSYNWFHIAFVFTLLDIGVLIVATMPAGVNILLAAAWLVGGAAAVVMLMND